MKRIPCSGRRLFVFREKHVLLNRAELAYVLGVCPSTIARWERFEAETIRSSRTNLRLLTAISTWLSSKERFEFWSQTELSELCRRDDGGLEALNYLLDMIGPASYSRVRRPVARRKGNVAA
jgi:hypothetical protein